MTLMLLPAAQVASERADVLAIGFIAGAVLMTALLIFGILTSEADGEAQSTDAPDHDGGNSKDLDG
ncbi:MAG TPA: hypothetical protein VFZ69_06530 [Longimicrobiales bacterium]